MAHSLSIVELENRVKEADTIEQYRRWQVILLRTRNPEMSVKKVAEICQVAYKTVTQWCWLYRRGGAESLLLSGRGGRYHHLMSKEAESDMLKNLQEKAEAGHIVTALSVKKAAEKILGRPVNKDYAYNVLHRHNWRKVMPHTYHPKGNKEAREAFKKTTRIFWIPPNMNLD